MLAFALVEEILFSCFFERPSALQATAAAFPLGLLLLCLLCRLMLHGNFGLCRAFVPGKTIGAWARGSVNGGELKILIAAVCKG